MKRILLLVNMTLGLGALANHAVANITHDEKPGYYSDNRTDLEFNGNTCGVMVNGFFVKSDIGIAFRSVGHLCQRPPVPFTIKGVGENGLDSIVVEAAPSEKNPVVINGVPYSDIVNYVQEKKTKWVTLEEIKKQYFPKVRGKCLYMVNKYFITKDWESYRLDKDFVLKVEALPSSECEIFEGQSPFTIIKVFTDVISNHNPGRIG